MQSRVAVPLLISSDSKDRKIMKFVGALIKFSFVALVFSASAAEQVTDITPPAEYKRVAAKPNSFTDYLRNLPLKKNKQIELWDGRILPDSAYDSMAVLDLPLLFNEDIEQCADFTMRIWAEYLSQSKQLEKLKLFDFYGRKKPFNASKKSLREYLRWHMRYSNSYSIKLGAKRVRLLNELEPGDMFVQNDSKESIGHVSMVIDAAENEFGLKVYLVGYSFMPAQQFHIEKADDEYGIEGWFTADGYQRYAEDAFSSFGKPVVMRY